MNKMIKIAAVCVAVALCAGTTFARGHRGPARGHSRVVRHHHVSRPVHRHCHGSAWGRGGRNFWPGFVGGIVGGAISARLFRNVSTFWLHRVFSLLILYGAVKAVLLL